MESSQRGTNPGEKRPKAKNKQIILKMGPSVKLVSPIVVLFLKEKWGYFFPVKRPEGGMVRDHRAD